MTRSEFPCLPDAATEEHAALLDLVTIALRASGWLAVPTPDPGAATVACIVNEMALVRFPAPNGRAVKVVYPIMFSPGQPL